MVNLLIQTKDDDSVDKVSHLRVSVFVFWQTCIFSLPIWLQPWHSQMQDLVSHCKGTSVCFITSPLLSYSPPVHMYSLSSPLYHLQGLHLKPTTSILTVQQLPRRRLTRSRWHPFSFTAGTWTAPHELGMHWDRSTWHYGTLHHHVDTHLWEAWW
jgi:hypothetical protein